MTKFSIRQLRVIHDGIAKQVAYVYIEAGRNSEWADLIWTDNDEMVRVSTLVHVSQVEPG